MGSCVLLTSLYHRQSVVRVNNRIGQSQGFLRFTKKGTLLRHGLSFLMILNAVLSTLTTHYALSLPSLSLPGRTMQKGAFLKELRKTFLSHLTPIILLFIALTLAFMIFTFWLVLAVLFFMAKKAVSVVETTVNRFVVVVNAEKNRILAAANAEKNKLIQQKNELINRLTVQKNELINRLTVQKNELINLLAVQKTELVKAIEASSVKAIDASKNACLDIVNRTIPIIKPTIKQASEQFIKPTIKQASEQVIKRVYAQGKNLIDNSINDALEKGKPYVMQAKSLINDTVKEIAAQKESLTKEIAAQKESLTKEIAAQKESLTKELTTFRIEITTFLNPYLKILTPSILLVSGSWTLHTLKWTLDTLKDTFEIAAGYSPMPVLSTAGDTLRGIFTSMGDVFASMDTHLITPSLFSLGTIGLGVTIISGISYFFYSRLNRRLESAARVQASVNEASEEGSVASRDEEAVNEASEEVPVASRDEEAERNVGTTDGIIKRLKERCRKQRFKTTNWVKNNHNRLKSKVFCVVQNVQNGWTKLQSTVFHVIQNGSERFRTTVIKNGLKVSSFFKERFRNTVGRRTN